MKNNQPFLERFFYQKLPGSDMGMGDVIVFSMLGIPALFIVCWLLDAAIMWYVIVGTIEAFLILLFAADGFMYLIKQQRYLKQREAEIRNRFEERSGK